MSSSLLSVHSLQLQVPWLWIHCSDCRGTNWFSPFFFFLWVSAWHFCTNSASFIRIPCRGSEVIPCLPRVQTCNQPTYNVPLQVHLQCIPNFEEVPQNLNIISLISVLSSRDMGRKSNPPCLEKRSWKSYFLKFIVDIPQAVQNIKEKLKRKP